MAEVFSHMTEPALPASTDGSIPSLKPPGEKPAVWQKATATATVHLNIRDGDKIPLPATAR